MTKRFIKRPRMPGFSYRGMVAYHLVLVTHDREPLLVDDLALAVTRQLKEVALVCQFELLAFTVMPDHLHLLICGHDHDANVVSFVQRFKQRTSYDHIQRHGTRLWQPSFFDRAIREHDNVEAIGRYIVENPVRAGFIARAEDWPHMGGTLVEDAVAVVNAATAGHS